MVRSVVELHNKNSTVTHSVQEITNCRFSSFRIIITYSIFCSYRFVGDVESSSISIDILTGRVIVADRLPEKDINMSITAENSGSPIRRDVVDFQVFFSDASGTYLF